MLHGNHAPSTHPPLAIILAMKSGELGPTAPNAMESPRTYIQVRGTQAYPLDAQGRT